MTKPTCGCPANAPEADSEYYACPCGDHCMDEKCLAANYGKKRKQGFAGYAIYDGMPGWTAVRSHRKPVSAQTLNELKLKLRSIEKGGE